MPYQAPHVLMTFGGDSFAQQETWSVGIRFQKSALPTPAQVQAAAEVFEVFWTGVASSNAYRFTFAKGALLDLQGRYPDGVDAVEYLLPAPVAGVNAPFPAQVALVCSWTTARTRGLASKGRMYVPIGSVNIDSNGAIPVGQQNLFASAAADLIPLLNAAVGGTAAIMSAVGAGASQPITGVRVGRIPDTQRRRRNALNEEYVTAPF